MAALFQELENKELEGPRAKNFGLILARHEHEFQLVSEALTAQRQDLANMLQ